MSKFKIGDRVKLITSPEIFHAGDVGVITDIEDAGWIRIELQGTFIYGHDRDIALLDADDIKTYEDAVRRDTNAGASMPSKALRAPVNRYQRFSPTWIWND